MNESGDQSENPAGAAATQDHPQPRADAPYLSTALTTAPYLTHVVEPVAGCIKARQEDFLVEELPLYDPVGEGEHIYLFIEKNGLSTTQLVDILSDHFKVKRGAIGYAGMKDKRAITRQVVSIHAPGKRPEDFPMLRHEQIGVLWTDLHTNKLRRGHLRGNRFSIRIRAVDPLRVTDAWRMLRFLEKRGMPNFFGDQRFGARLNNHILGRFLITRHHQQLLDTMLGPDPEFPSFNVDARRHYELGRFDQALGAMPKGLRTERQALSALNKGRAPADAIQAVDDLQRRFWVSAWQSAIFNRVLARRLEQGTLDVLLPGDIALIHANGAMFRVDHDTAEDPETQERAKRFEISPTGPMWGADMMIAEGEPGAVERDELERDGVTEADLPTIMRTFGDSLAGTRRALRVPVTDPDAEGGADEHGPFIRVAFELPPGSFATSVLRELMKTFPLECSHIARRGDHAIYGRDPMLPPGDAPASAPPLVRIDTIAKLDDQITNRYADRTVGTSSADTDHDHHHDDDHHD